MYKEFINEKNEVCLLTELLVHLSCHLYLLIAEWYERKQHHKFDNKMYRKQEIKVGAVNSLFWQNLSKKPCGNE